MAKQQGSFRVPPQAIEVEKHVIGAMMLDQEAIEIVTSVLDPNDFYMDKHQAMYTVIRDMAIKDMTIDGLTYLDELKKTPHFDRAGGEQYLMEVSAEVVSSANIAQHCRIIKDKAILRELIGASTRILERSYDGTMEPPDILELAEQDILRIGGSSLDPMLKTIPTIIKDAAKKWDATMAGHAPGIMTGIPPLDDILKGLQGGKLYLLSARPGLGKSMLALQVAANCGKPVAHFTPEMLAVDQLERMVSQESTNLNSETLRDAEILRTNQEALRLALSKIRDKPVRFYDDPYVTPATVMAQSRRMKREIGLGLVVIDYLQLMSGVGRFQNREQEITSISRGLKGVAMKMDVPVLAIASLSRKCEERTNKRPVESDLRESGNLESDTDGLIFLYRHSRYSARAEEQYPNTTEISVPKNRGGRTGRAITEFDPAHSKYYATHPDAVRSYLDFLKPKRKADGEGQGGVEKGPAGKPPPGKPGPASDWGAPPPPRRGRDAQVQAEF